MPIPGVPTADQTEAEQGLIDDKAITPLTAAAAIKKRAEEADYTPLGANTVIRTFKQKLRDHPDVREWGATGNNVTDDTDAINKAIAAVQAAQEGGTLHFSRGTYLVDGTISVFDAPDVPVGFGVRLTGAGPQTRIWTTSPTADIVDLRAAHSSIDHILVGTEPGVTRTGGVHVTLRNYHTACDFCHIERDYIGVKLIGEGGKARFNILSGAVPGAKRFWATGGDTSQIILGNFTAAQFKSANVGAAVYVDDSAALRVAFNDFMGQGRCLWIDPPAGKGVYSLLSTGNRYDNSLHGIAVTASGNVYRCKSVDDWVSSMSENGIMFQTFGGTIDGFTINSPEAYDNDGYGVAIQGNTKNVIVNAPEVRANRTGGILIDGAPRGTIIRNPLMTAGFGWGVNPIGISIGSGADEYDISGGDVSGQTSATILGHTAAPTRLVRDVKGYKNKVSGVAIIPAGSTSVTFGHGLAGTPTKHQLTLLTAPNAATYGYSLWDASTATISINTTVGVNKPFYYELEV